MATSADTPPPADTQGTCCLLVEAGARKLACSFAAVLMVGSYEHVAQVPGSSHWLLGLIQWRGRLLTVVDAGRLFGYQPSRPRHIIVLRGLRVDTALAVDTILALEDPGGIADLVLDVEALSAHPALQPGAAASAPPPGQAA
ncbi:MAG TPA: chemotaxis protein CheW [Planctomycetota bacterium]|nr:chemotaxis protein CheW [Planctomycetota bacterium]